MNKKEVKELIQYVIKSEDEIEKYKQIAKRYKKLYEESENQLREIKFLVAKLNEFIK